MLGLAGAERPEEAAEAGRRLGVRLRQRRRVRGDVVRSAHVDEPEDEHPDRGGRDEVEHPPLVLLGRGRRLRDRGDRALEEAIGRLDRRQRSNPGAGLLDPSQLFTVRGAVGEEVVDLGALGLGQLAVEVGAQKLERVGGRQRGHPSIVLSWARPRWMRLRTVPTGTSSDSAISW